MCRANDTADNRLGYSSSPNPHTQSNCLTYTHTGTHLNVHFKTQRHPYPDRYPITNAYTIPIRDVHLGAIAPGRSPHILPGR